MDGGGRDTLFNPLKCCFILFWWKSSKRQSFMSGSTWQGTGLVAKGPVNQENSREVQCLESELIMKIKAP